MIKMGVATPIYFGFNEWTSGFIYGTDVLFVLLLFLWLLRYASHPRTSLLRGLSFEAVISTLLIAITAFSFSSAHNIYLAIFRYIKLAEMIALFWYIRSATQYFSRKDIILALIWAIFLELILAVGQIALQHNLGLWFLGEGYFLPGGHSVASFHVGDSLFLRAYGAFQHPNVLAFFAFMVLNLSQALYIFFNEPLSKRLNALLGMATVASLWVIGLSFSRSVMVLVIGMRVVLFALACILSRSDQRHKRIIDVLVVSLSTIAVFSFLFWPQVSARRHFDTQEEAYQDRVAYNREAGSIAQSHKISGVGIGHFVYNEISQHPYLDAYYFQPAHNIYLLIAAELGYAGLLVFSLWIGYVWLYKSFIEWQSDRAFAFWRFVFLAGIISLGFVDHYQWTLHQGMLIFFIILAII